jgi:hypothetical protein
VWEGTLGFGNGINKILQKSARSAAYSVFCTMYKMPHAARAAFAQPIYYQSFRCEISSMLLFIGSPRIPPAFEIGRVRDLKYLFFTAKNYDWL